MNYPYQPNGDPNQNAPWNMPPQPPPDQWQPNQQPGPGQPEQPGYGPPASGPPGYGPPDQQGYGPPASGPPGYQPDPYSAPPQYGPPSGPPDMYGAAGPSPGGPEIPGMPGGPQPPKKSRAPLVMMLVLGVVFVLGVGVSLFLILGDDTTETTTSGKTSPVEESDSPSPSESTSEPDPTPTDDPGDSTYTGTLDEADYNDWDFQIGDVSLSADKVDGWNYEDCTEIENDGALTDLGCKEAIEIAYEAEDGEMKLDLVLMVMEDEESAASLESEFQDTMYSPQDAGFIKDFDFGKFRIGNESNIGVLTMGTATSAVDEADADEYLSYMFTDHKSALLFM